MPKTLPLLVLFFLAVSMTPASAQRARVGRVSLKLGGSLAQYRGEDIGGGYGNLGGFCGGGVIHLPVGSVFSVQPEFLYSQKGARSQAIMVSKSVGAVGNQRLAYVEVPVLVKLRSHTGPFIEFGPTLSYLLSASANFSAPIGGQHDFDNRSQFNAFVWGYAAGIGYQDAKGLMLGVRYCGGLSPIFTANAYSGYLGINGEPRIYNQTFQLYAGYILFDRPQAEFPQ